MSILAHINDNYLLHYCQNNLQRSYFHFFKLMIFGTEFRKISPLIKLSTDFIIYLSHGITQLLFKTID